MENKLPLNPNSSYKSNRETRYWREGKKERKTGKRKKKQERKSDRERGYWRGIKRKRERERERPINEAGFARRSADRI